METAKKIETPLTIKKYIMVGCYDDKNLYWSVTGYVADTPEKLIQDTDHYEFVKKIIFEIELPIGKAEETNQKNCVNKKRS